MRNCKGNEFVKTNNGNGNGYGRRHNSALNHIIVLYFELLILLVECWMVGKKTRRFDPMYVLGEPFTIMRKKKSNTHNNMEHHTSYVCCVRNAIWRLDECRTAYQMVWARFMAIFCSKIIIFNDAICLGGGDTIMNVCALIRIGRSMCTLKTHTNHCEHTHTDIYALSALMVVCLPFQTPTEPSVKHRRLPITIRAAAELN